MSGRTVDIKAAWEGFDEPLIPYPKWLIRLSINMGAVGAQRYLIHYAERWLLNTDFCMILALALETESNTWGSQNSDSFLQHKFIGQTWQTLKSERMAGGVYTALNTLMHPCIWGGWAWWQSNRVVDETEAWERMGAEGPTGQKPHTILVPQ